MMIQHPVVLYIGGATSKTDAKTAYGLYEWRREVITGQLVDETVNENLLLPGVPVMDVPEAVAAGAKTLVIGVAPHDGRFNPAWMPLVLRAMSFGLDIACGTHSRLVDVPELVAAAEKYGVNLIDFRHRGSDYPKGTGEVREGYRVLTVGVDCSCGKKFTTMSMFRAHRQHSENVMLATTGQTGFLISDSGINNDTITADFLSGAAEFLTPSNREAIYYVEGQGSILHPSYAGGSLSLIQGTQPDGLIVCLEAGRTSYLGHPYAKPLPTLADVVETNLYMARKFNPNCELLGFSVKDKDQLTDAELVFMECFNVPVIDPSCDDLNPLVMRIEHARQKKLNRMQS